MFATVPLRFVIDRDRLVGAAAGERAPLELPRSRYCTAGAFTFGALTTTLAGSAVPGNACCMRLYVLTTASDCGNVSGPGVAMLQLQRGHRERKQQAAGE